MAVIVLIVFCVNISFHIETCQCGVLVLSVALTLTLRITGGTVSLHLQGRNNSLLVFLFLFFIFVCDRWISLNPFSKIRPYLRVCVCVLSNSKLENWWKI